MGFGASQMTNTTGAVFLPEVWAKEAEVAREANLQMTKWVKRYDADVKNGGTKVNIPFVSNLTSTAVADNTAVTFQAPTESEIELPLSRHFESSFAIQDRLKIQSAYNLGMEYSQKIGYALALKMEQDLTGLYSGLSQTVGTTSEVTAANITRSILYLDNADVPQTDRHMAVRPSTMYSLRNIADFTFYEKTGNTSVSVGGNGGKVGNVFGLEVGVSTAVVSTSNVAKNLIFHRDAFAMAVQKDVTIEEDRQPSYLATGYVASALWGYVELRDDHAVLLNTKDNIA